MSIFTETDPHPEAWLLEEQERIMRAKLGDALYEYLEELEEYEIKRHPV